MGDEYQLRKDIDTLFNLFYRTKFVQFKDDSDISNLTLDDILDQYELKEVLNIIIAMQDKINELDERVKALEEEN